MSVTLEIKINEYSVNKVKPLIFTQKRKLKSNNK